MPFSNHRRIVVGKIKSGAYSISLHITYPGLLKAEAKRYADAFRRRDPTLDIEVRMVMRGQWELVISPQHQPPDVSQWLQDLFVSLVATKRDCAATQSWHLETVEIRTFSF